MDDAAILREIARRIREGIDKTGRDGTGTDDAGESPVDAASAEAEQMLRRLAHELKTPLSAIVAAAEIMSAQSLGPIENSHYRAYVADIAASGRHALVLVERMLGGGATTALPQREFEYTQLDLNHLVERAASVLRTLAGQRDQEIAVILAPALPALIADATSLRQILINLITNAIKYADTGATITISTGSLLDGPLTLEVSDTGPGISPEIVTAVLGSDRPLGSITTKGHGLGLPLVRQLAEANGATLAITGNGATKVTLTFSKDRVVPV